MDLPDEPLVARRGKAPPATQLHDGSVLVAAVVTSFHPAIAARLLDGAREREEEILPPFENHADSFTPRPA